MPIALADLPSARLESTPPGADLRTRLHAATRTMRALQALFARLASTLWINIGMIQDLDATPAEREQALDWLARRLERRWRVVDPRVRRQLARRAEAQDATRTQAKVDALKPAIWLALRGDIDEPHTMYFRSEEWLVDEEGHKLAIAPSALPTPFSDRWAVSRIIKLAEAYLLDETLEGYEQTRARLTRMGEQPEARLHLDGVGDIQDSDADPLYILLEREAAADEAALYDALWRHATLAQRRLLTTWLDQLAVGGSLADAAYAVGIAESTGYVQLYRLRAALRGRRRTE
jgi:hypothetical protein